MSYVNTPGGFTAPYIDLSGPTAPASAPPTTTFGQDVKDFFGAFLPTANVAAQSAITRYQQLQNPQAVQPRQVSTPSTIPWTPILLGLGTLGVIGTAVFIFTSRKGTIVKMNPFRKKRRRRSRRGAAIKRTPFGYVLVR